MKLSQKDIAAIEKLLTCREEGMSSRDIGERYQVYHTTMNVVIYMLRKIGVTHPVVVKRSNGVTD